MEMLLTEMAERGEFQKREAMETRKVFQEEKSGQWCHVWVRALVRWRMTTLDFGNRKVTRADRQVMWKGRGQARRGKRGEEVEKIHLKSS